MLSVSIGSTAEAAAAAVATHSTSHHTSTGVPRVVFVSLTFSSTTYSDETVGSSHLSSPIRTASSDYVPLRRRLTLKYRQYSIFVTTQSTNSTSRDPFLCSVVVCQTLLIRVDSSRLRHLFMGHLCVFSIVFGESTSATT